ncbi:MAG: HAD-IA family hydrolase [Planctomycetota bacterium]
MFQTILLDLDGTLIDSAADIGASVNHVRNHYGLGALGRAETDAAIGDGVRVLLEKTLLTDLRVASNPAARDEALLLYMEHQSQHCLDQTVLYPGVAGALEKLSKKAALAVVSNKPTALCVKILQGLGMIQYFRACVGGDTPAGRKPAPGPALRALEALGGRVPWDTLFVGDSTADLECGRAALMATCAVSWGYRPLELLQTLNPDFVIHQMSELHEIVKWPEGTSNLYEVLGREKIYQLAAAFYARVRNDERIRFMFPKDFKDAIEHQALFFIQFFGGPSEYNEKRGAPRLRMRHANFPINSAARDAWLNNMIEASGEVELPEPAKGIFLRYVTYTANMLVNKDVQ